MLETSNSNGRRNSSAVQIVNMPTINSLQDSGRRASVCEPTSPHGTSTRTTSPMLATVVRIAHKLEGSPRPVPFDLVRMRDECMHKLAEGKPAYVLHSTKVIRVDELSERITVPPGSAECYKQIVQTRFLQDKQVKYVADPELLDLLVLLVFHRPVPWVVVCTLQPIRV
jgi:hypothetical protein